MRDADGIFQSEPAILFGTWGGGWGYRAMCTPPTQIGKTTLLSLLRAQSLSAFPTPPCHVPADPRTQLFLVFRGVDQQVFLDVLRIQLLVHPDKQLLGFGVHIAHVHAPFVVEQDVVPLSGSIDADVELLRLARDKSLRWVGALNRGQGAQPLCCHF